MVRKVDQVNVPIFLAIIPMFTLCGTTSPHTLPPLLGAFAGILPLASLVDLLRWPLGLPQWWPLLLLWLVGWTVLLARLALCGFIQDYLVNLFATILPGGLDRPGL